MPTNLYGFLMNNYSGNETVNAGTGKELTIKALTELVAKVVGYEGKSSGTHRDRTTLRESCWMSARRRLLGGSIRRSWRMG